MHTFYIFVALSVLLITMLAMNVSRLRMREQVANGDGGNKPLRKAIRAHMNTLEQVLPFALVLLALASLSLASAWLNLLAYGFLLVRVLHSYAMLASQFRLRQITAALSYIFQVVACVAVLLAI